MAENHPIPKNPRFIDLTGKEYGRLTVVSYAGMQGWAHLWNCLCKCGNRTLVGGSDLRGKHTKSCGCFRAIFNRAKHTTHGMAGKNSKKSGEYCIWKNMNKRCYNENTPNYSDYGGRGVSVCQQWRESFAQFLSDMGMRPSSKHSIDRINNDGNYEPGNCRWASRIEQNNNTRKNRWLTHDNQTHTISEWGRMLGLSHQLIGDRLRLGWTESEALTTPKGTKRIKQQGF